jgi:hypothetical protein
MLPMAWQFVVVIVGTGAAGAGNGCGRDAMICRPTRAPLRGPIKKKRQRRLIGATPRYPSCVKRRSLGAS